MSAFENGRTVRYGGKKKAKEDLGKLSFSKDEFLFIGEDFYFVDKLCPTRRLMSTFR